MIFRCLLNQSSFGFIVSVIFSICLFIHHCSQFFYFLKKVLVGPAKMQQIFKKFCYLNFDRKVGQFGRKMAQKQALLLIHFFKNIFIFPLQGRKIEFPMVNWFPAQFKCLKKFYYQDLTQNTPGQSNCMILCSVIFAAVMNGSFFL